ncbi:Na/Pi cotransporter family protein [Corticibacter populi]|uniref:Na/Pi cotransporter family protein n=1 Tax=Corticibacter populi TaxID=1550736 RepID=A0A3M6QZG9_9BURK|nr:Na/Pi symporter [Corticibacter populi]RMX07932.1 Na/Pi cotransporter family protein [Corticibacter populi]RZS35171.1 phosphate:Na+ symporter [Corticibacter populi]
MLATLSTLAGGIGLFLLGMVLMSDSLKAMAGESLRTALARFTGQPFQAMLVGMGATAAVQSSTATTMATIGFVSAGLLTFQNSIGVIIGANIGSTSTGWIVALLGMKFSIASVAMPIIGLGALMKLLGRDKLALAGLALAGFGLIFVGIEYLQQAMAGMAGHVDLTRFSSPGWSTRLVLVIIGIVMTVLLQASSAALAATLAALSSGTIDFAQAAALVIGQNIGTTATALLAAAGGSASAKRTALVHLLFNLGSAVLAFFILLPLAVQLVRLWSLRHGSIDMALALAAFHTAFSVTGALVFLPQAQLLARLASRLVPESAPPGLRYLDASLQSVPALAIAAAEKTVCLGLSDTCHLLAQRLQGQPLASSKSGLSLEKLLAAVDDYLSRLPVPQSASDQQRLKHLLLLLDQTRVLRDDLQSIGHAEALRAQSSLWDLATRLAPPLERSAAWLADDSLPLREDVTEELRQVSEWVHEQQTAARRTVVEDAASYRITPAAALEQLTAQRWLERLAKHITRIAETLGEARALFHE